MQVEARVRLPEIERRVCDVASAHLHIPRDQVHPSSRIIQDLHCDSLDLIELIMQLEDEFSVTISNDVPNPSYKAVFTRNPFRLADLAESIYLQWGSGTPERTRRRSSLVNPPTSPSKPFTQLSGRWTQPLDEQRPLFEWIERSNGTTTFRRQSDGMRCIALPSAEVRIGSDVVGSLVDERPAHVVELDSFLIDAEPVSTTAYCRFLNSIEGTTAEHLSDWFLLDPQDDRHQQMQLRRSDDGWEPVAGTDDMPMVLVSWFGACAYSLWANGQGWRQYRGEDPEELFLPSEAQWEYAARGAQGQDTNDSAVCARHEPGRTYQADTMPMAAVNEPLGVSPFGLHHMAGNVWHWCLDWYDEGFYRRPEARQPNPVNRQNSGVRSERGGSWVGPAELCRTSYRRGRAPEAKGRCLGFRCISLSSRLPSAP